MAQVPTVVIQPLNYDHKFPWHGTAEGGDDFIGQSRVTQLIKQGRSLWLLEEQHSKRGAGLQQGQGVPSSASRLRPSVKAAALTVLLCRGDSGGISVSDELGLLVRLRSATKRSLNSF